MTANVGDVKKEKNNLHRYIQNNIWSNILGTVAKLTDSLTIIYIIAKTT